MTKQNIQNIRKTFIHYEGQNYHLQLTDYVLYKLSIQCVPKKYTPLEITILLLNVRYYVSWNLHWLLKHTATQCTHRIIDKFNVLRQQPDIVRNAVRDMHKRTILCVKRNGGYVQRHGPYSFKFHLDKQTIIYSCNRFC